MDKDVEKIAAIESMKWYGWGSPIGLTVFFVGLSIGLAILIYSIGHVFSK